MGKNDGGTGVSGRSILIGTLCKGLSKAKGPPLM